MTIYSLYIFSPSCTCVYYHNWHPVPNPSPAVPGPEVLPTVSRLVSPILPSELRSSSSSKLEKPPTDRFSGLGGTLVARGAPTPTPGQTMFDVRGGWASAGEKDAPESEGTKGMGFDEECKLLYGVVFSLRGMIKKLNGGKDDPYLAYQTPAYKLHALHTPTSYTFIITSSASVDSLRPVLRQLYGTTFLEYVIHNPLIQLYNRTRFQLPPPPSGEEETEEQRRKREKQWRKTSMKDKGERGIDNVYFRNAVDQLIRGLNVFD